jgi:hypothetical protein
VVKEEVTMPNAIRTLSFAIAAVLAALVAGPAQAATEIMRVNIPFRFAAGDAVMPAGTYFVTLSEASRSMKLEGWKHAIYVPVTVTGLRPLNSTGGQGALLFEKFGNTYVLRKAWNPGRALGCALHASKRIDKELARRPQPAVTIASTR